MKKWVAGMARFKVVFIGALLPLMSRFTALATEEASGERVSVAIERTPVQWLVIFIGLAFFWTLVLGLFTVLVWKVKEADRLFRLRE